MPFSLEELTPANKLLMIERGMANELFGDYGYLGRDIGLTVEGEFGQNRVPLGYAVGFYNGNAEQMARDDNNAKVFVQRLTLKPRRWLTLGLNATQRNDSITGRLVNAFGGDFSWQFWRAVVKGELLAGNSEPGYHMIGGYVVGRVSFGTFEPGLKVERVGLAGANFGQSETELTLGCNWHLHRQVELKMNLITRPRGLKMPGSRLLVQGQVNF
ncbi:MAG: hypothetical protein ACUVUR_04425 [bacterium]